MEICSLDGRDQSREGLPVRSSDELLVDLREFDTQSPAGTNKSGPSVVRPLQRYRDGGLE
jgi:hypothetical protein